MHSRNSSGNRIWDMRTKDYQKSSKTVTSFFMEISMRNENRQELGTSLFLRCQICSEVNYFIFNFLLKP